MDFNKYNNFLKDWPLYKENKAIWKQLIDKTTEIPFEQWAVTVFANGKDFFDGNPIFSAYFPSLSKAIRIVQVEKKLSNPLFSAWLKATDFDNEQIEELVISLQLNRNTFNDTERLISHFLTKKSTNEFIAVLNEKYDKAWDSQKIKFIVAAIEQNSSLNYINDIKYDNLKTGKINIANIKRVNATLLKILTQDINTNSIFKRRLGILKLRAQKVSGLLSLEDDQFLLRKLNQDEYFLELKKRFSNPYNFYRKLERTRESFSESFEEFKELTE